MFGLEILDVVIGLIFVYLLLSLFATAVNEYIAAVLNLRGKELARGLGRLLDDLTDDAALAKAQAALKPRPKEEPATPPGDNTGQSTPAGEAGTGQPPATRAGEAQQGGETRTDKPESRAPGLDLIEKLYNHHLIKPLRTQGVVTGKSRLPSYIPARSFAMALLDELGYEDETLESKGAKAEAHPEVKRIIELLKKESPRDVKEQITHLEAQLANNAALPADLRLAVANQMAAAQTKLQNLHDSVEVWFNNAMDRVSGSYKRKTQLILFVIGLVTALVMNADTLQMWRQLSENDQLATAMANRAAATAGALDIARRGEAAPADTTQRDTGTANRTTVPDTSTVPPDTGDTTVPNPPPANVQTPASQDTGAVDTAAVRRAAEVYRTALARLDSMELKLGWTPDEFVRIGWARWHAKPDTTATGRPVMRAPGAAAQQPAPEREARFEWPAGRHLGPLLLKIFGLLLTAIAISLGAPFWFDLLNKVISIRSAGRSPAERPKSPEGPAKRTAEQAIK